MRKDFFNDKLDRLDPLTKIYDRSVLNEYTIELIHRKNPFVFCFVDIDNFKNINDTYGHSFGDKVLTEFAQLLKNSIGDRGSVARYGGDEFIIVIPGEYDYDQTWKICYEILTIPRKIEDEKIKEADITLTLGSARYPLDSTNVDGIIELSDKALYRGKMKGRNCFIIYLPEKHADINLKTERDKVVSSTYLHNIVYKNIVEGNNLKENIRATLEYFADYFMIDHLCLQDDSNLYCECRHKLCKPTPFYPIPYEELNGHFIGNNAVFTKNKIDDDDKSSRVLSRLLNDNIYSMFYVRIKINDHLYGYLRADINNNDQGRIWQSLHKDILQVMANYIATRLDLLNIELKDL